MENTKIVPSTWGIYAEIARRMKISRVNARMSCLNGSKKHLEVYNEILSERIRACETANNLNKQVKGAA